LLGNDLLHLAELLDNRMRLFDLELSGLWLAAEKSHCAGIRMAIRFSSPD
jgi:hypothetical protein